MRVVVVGAGIAGLTAADFVSRDRPDVEVVVLEQSARVGGKLLGADLAGARIDVGAEAMLARRPEGIDLIARLGLGADRLSPVNSRASLWVDGSLRPLPGRTVLGVPADDASMATVLSPAGLARLAAAPDVDAPRLTEDVSVGQLVGSRLGQEVVDRLVDPLLGGIYAGRADEISLRAAIPDLARELTARGGSLLAAAGAVIARRPVDTSPVFATVPGGLQRLPPLIVERGRFSVRTNTAVRSIVPVPGGSGFELEIGSRADGERLTADAVIVATPPAKAAGLLRDLAPSAAAELAGIRTASMAIVSLAFPAGTPLPPGSGVLVPATSGRAVKAITISSQKWGPEPDGLVRLRASLGRIGEEAVLQREDHELISVTRRDLADLLRLTTHPVDAVVTRWGGGLPQYDVGHLERVGRIRAAVEPVPGLAVAGASYDGVGIPACIRSARLAADRVLALAFARGQ